MKLILVAVIVVFSFICHSREKIDSLFAKITFENGFCFGKKVLVKVNDEIVFNKRINTIKQIGYADGCDLFFSSEDKITVKIGFFKYGIKINEIIKGYIYVRVNRFLLFNLYSYHQRPALYD